MPHPTTAKPYRRRTKYKVVCGTCGYTRWLQKTDCQRVRECRYCAARIGYQAMYAKHGRLPLLAYLQQREIDKPSKPEQAVIAILDSLGVAYRRQVIFQGEFLLDFLIADCIALEVNGYWHKRVRKSRDARLCANWHGSILWVDADDICPVSIREFLEQKAGIVSQ